MSQFYMSTSGGSAPTTSGSLVLIQEQTASGASSLIFSSGITTTYDEYYIRFSGVQSNGSNLYLQLSIDGGANWISANYDASITYSDNLITTGIYIPLVAGLTLLTNPTTTSGACHSGNTHMFGLTANQFMPCSISKSKCTGNVFIGETDMCCYKIAPLVVNAMKILPDSGTFSGTFKLYGVIP